MSLTPLQEEPKLRTVTSVDPLDRAVEELNVRLSKIEHGAKISAGPCTECKYYHCLNPLVSIASDYVCANPLVSLPSFDPTAHKPTFSWIRLDSARARGPCGPEGRLYEPRELYRRESFWVRVVIGFFVLVFSTIIYSCVTGQS
jgi:hypothetical protein